jgi:Secretion system C-terminal sorting domain
MRKIVLIISLISLVQIGFAQELMLGLSENPVIKKHIADSPSSLLKSSKMGAWVPITLPFFDDFKTGGPYPSESRWIDSEAFVNNEVGKFSTNLGVATMDAIDAEGFIYSNANIFPFLADRLTSRPIRLDSVFQPVPAAISRKDSVYFSFYYQPQGYGDKPQEEDSLILQFGHYGQDSSFNYIDSVQVALNEYIGPNDTVFPGDTLYSPCDFTWGMMVRDTLYYDDLIMIPCDSVYFPDVEWFEVWGDGGMPLDTFYKKHGSYTKQVTIPILDSVNFYRDDFFFRFLNYASLDTYAPMRSNSDQWNLDYIYLNIGRSLADTFYRDIGFVETSPSMLNNYEMMPYDQYLANPTNSIKDEFKMYITNLDNNTYNTLYKYELTNAEGTFERTYDGGVCNLRPFTSGNDYQNCDECAQHACPPWKFLFPLNYSKEYDVFKIQHIILGDITTSDTIKDTLNYYQRFYNFYAYDDGTAESGYGVQGSGEKVAYRFTLNRPDTLYGLQMFINRTQNDANDMYFDLAVWRDNAGEPGELLFTKANNKPKFPDQLNQMQFYPFNEGVAVSNTFWVGWIQYTNNYLNVGFDRTRDASEQISYYVPGEGWFKTLYDGALMIRPIMSDKYITGTEEIISNQVDAIEIYPNPVNGGVINIRVNGNTNDQIFDYSIYNTFGQQIKTGQTQNQISTKLLNNGVYILRLFWPEKNKTISKKIIISN